MGSEFDEMKAVVYEHLSDPDPEKSQEVDDALDAICKKMISERNLENRTILPSSSLILLPGGGFIIEEMEKGGTLSKDDLTKLGVHMAKDAFMEAVAQKGMQEALAKARQANSEDVYLVLKELVAPDVTLKTAVDLPGPAIPRKTFRKSP